MIAEGFGDAGLLITVLVVLAIVALVVWIARH
jgi:hypothetical protein